MTPVRVVVETDNATVEYVVHVVNRSRHALRGAVRSGWKRHTNAKAVSAEFTTHHCDQCAHDHHLPPVRRTFRRVRSAA